MEPKSLCKERKALTEIGPEINKLESIYYQIIGRTMRKGKPLDNIMAIMEIYGEVNYLWEDHYCFTKRERTTELSCNNIDENLFQ